MEPANLKGYWKCNETSGTTLADSSGNSKNLTITGAINTNYWLGESGEQGTCFRTDGVAGYASRNDAVIPSLDNRNFTLFALFKGGTDFGSAAALAGIGLGIAGCAVVRAAILSTLLDLAGQPQPEHVHVDRARHRGRVRL